MYMCDLQLDIICTYKLINEEGDDEIGLKQLLYQVQLLQILNLEPGDYDIDRINDKINYLYDILKDQAFVQELLLKNPYRLQLNYNNELIFRTLFSYDYFDLFHKCLYCYYNKTSMDNVLTLLKMEYHSN